MRLLHPGSPLPQLNHGPGFNPTHLALMAGSSILRDPPGPFICLDSAQAPVGQLSLTMNRADGTGPLSQHSSSLLKDSRAILYQLSVWALGLCARTGRPGPPLEAHLTS